MKKALFSAVMVLPAALFAAGMEEQRAQGLPPVDAGSILAQIEQQNHIPAPQPIISMEMQKALAAASDLRKDLKARGVKAKVGLFNEPDFSYALWAEFRNWTDFEKAKGLFREDHQGNLTYKGYKVSPRVPKAKPAQLIGAERSMDFFDEWGDGAEKIPAALKSKGIRVLTVETNDNVTTVCYESAEWIVKTAETKGEYGPSDGAKIDSEAKKIAKELKAAGKAVIWTGRWGDMVNGATVYYLERLSGEADRADTALGPLMAAVKDAQRDELDSMGYYVGFLTYPAKTKPAKIYADITGYSESDIYPEMFSMSAGEPCVRAMARYLRDEAKDAVEESDEPSDKVIAEKLRGVASAQEKAFLTPNRFTSLKLASHNRQEDGDLDYRILIAQEKDGSLRVLSYIRNPY